MKRLTISPVIITLIPILAIIPVSITLLSSIHGGGISLIERFLKSSITPSLDVVVIHSAWNGLIDTLAIAGIAWLVSCTIGTIIALLTSQKISNILFGSDVCMLIVKRILSIPRSIHEVIWALVLIQIIGLSKWTAIIALVIPYSTIYSRVLSDQIDTLDFKSVQALVNSGSNPISALATGLIPKMLPAIISYSGYRLECSIRGSTILGIFGLGGIGTELELTLRSLEFREMWTSLWILGITIFIFERITSTIRNKVSLSSDYLPRALLRYLVIGIPIIVYAFYQFLSDSTLGQAITWEPIPFPTNESLALAMGRLPLINLISSTIILTLLSAGIAIGTPPLTMLVLTSKTGIKLQRLTWLILRLIPTPLIALLLQLVTYPDLAVGAMALGAHHMGVMGRLLHEAVESNGPNMRQSFATAGASMSSQMLYGSLTTQARSYLAYSAYRTDVILRETAVVGLIGGTGLGRQLIESLSSFDWGELTILILTYSILTLSGEILSDKIRDYWMHNKRNNSYSTIALQS